MHFLTPSSLPTLPIVTKRAGVGRRSFLQGMGGAGIGLLVGVRNDVQAQGSGAAAGTRPAHSGGGAAFNGFVRVAPDNTVTVVVKHLEMGQGPYTGLATLVAEEMDADWSQVRAEAAPANDELYKNTLIGMQLTGGSTAIANSWEQMRKAGAAARFMLVTAAAESWGVAPSAITVDRGVLSHRATGRRATFGEMAERAARVTAPADPRLKDSKDYKLIGRRAARLDSADKSNGKAVFTIDIDRPGLLTVLVAHPPRFGSVAQQVDDSAARRIKGVVDVKTIPQGVAVYADGYWAAAKARDALRIAWNDDKAERRGTPELLAEYRARIARTGTVAAARGDFDRAFAAGTRTIEAEYVFPYLAHAPMEPLDCVVELKDGTCRAWYGCQAQTIDHQVLATTIGVPKERVFIETQLAGGSFGRRATPNAELVAEAAAALKALGRDGAVKLVWTREDDVKGGFYRPFVVQKIRAALDGQGRIAAWDHVIAAQSFIKGSVLEGAMVKNDIDPTMVEGGNDLPYAIPNFRVSAHTMQVGVPTLWWRSVGHSHNAFSTETMIDELLQAAGKDPVQGRLEMLGAHPREAGVLRAVAKAAGWAGARAGPGRARGVAVHKSFESYVAHVVEVSRGSEGLPKVEKVWCAVDCGVAVNPDNVRSQMEGGIGFALSAALFDQITLDRGRVEQSNFNDYRMLRMDEMPKVEVVIVASTEKPTGVGEPGVPPVAPALANAWRALTGQTVRQLPFLGAPASGRDA